MRWDLFALELLKPLGQIMMAGALIYAGIILGKAIMVVDLAKVAMQEADAKTKLAEAKLKEMGETDVLTHKDSASGRHFWEVTTTTEENKDVQ